MGGGWPGGGGAPWSLAPWLAAARAMTCGWSRVNTQGLASHTSAAPASLRKLAAGRVGRLTLRRLATQLERSGIEGDGEAVGCRHGRFKLYD